MTYKELAEYIFYLTIHIYNNYLNKSLKNMIKVSKKMIEIAK